MRKMIIPLFAVTLLVIGGCKQQETKVEEQEQQVLTCTFERYKLYPTKNMWTFIKLDTQTGRMWQVQYTVDEEKDRFITGLNPEELVTDGKKVNGRFELYETQNFYNFILLDKITGKTWQVQWALKIENRIVVPIN